MNVGKALCEFSKCATKVNCLVFLGDSKEGKDPLIDGAKAEEKEAMEKILNYVWGLEGSIKENSGSLKSCQKALFVAREEMLKMRGEFTQTCNFVLQALIRGNHDHLTIEALEAAIKKYEMENISEEIVASEKSSLVVDQLKKMAHNVAEARTQIFTKSKKPGHEYFDEEAARHEKNILEYVGWLERNAEENKNLRDAFDDRCRVIELQLEDKKFLKETLNDLVCAVKKHIKTPSPLVEMAIEIQKNLLEKESGEPYPPGGDGKIEE